MFKCTIYILKCKIGLLTYILYRFTVLGRDCATFFWNLDGINVR